MSAPCIVAVEEQSPAGRAGLRVGDEILQIDGRSPRDVLDYRWSTDEADPTLVVRRGGVEFDVSVPKPAGTPLGVEVHSAVFDRVMTCDNHCEFCFIYQLPPGMRRSLYLKDDDYRLSFLYGNFTTLTRFTEADFERVLDEGLSPLNVSIHATDPQVRAAMLRNRRGGTSLRWLRTLLDAGVEVHGQVVVCPGVNDGAVLEDTMVGIADRYNDLASVCVVPLGVSRYNSEPRMRPHTVAESAAVLECVERWQATFLDLFGRRVVFAADEYYLAAGRPFPEAEAYEGFGMHEDGVGMARLFEAEFTGVVASTPRPSGFFAAVDGAPAEGYRAPRTAPTTATNCGGEQPVVLRRAVDAPVTVLSGTLGASVVGDVLTRHGYDDVEVLAVPSSHFGGTTGVTGLIVGADLQAALADAPRHRRYLLPDVCLSQGRFLDGVTPEELCRPVEVVPTDGASLRRLLDARVRPGVRS
ncbi:MAG: DUF512 domain-containing protein [Acidimicrobiia bacterium]|nr:DUF512 domain-containing protein [Acidimicrobiia bacterium]